MQNRVAVFVLVIDVVALGEEALDRLDIPLCGGLPDVGRRLVLRYFLCLGSSCETGHGKRHSDQRTVNSPHHLQEN